MEGGPMVSSSTGAMNSLLDKFPSLLDKLPELESMRQDLESLRNDVLEKFAERGVIRGAKIKEWMEQVREVVYDMEDWIDLCIHPSKPDKPEPATNFGWSDDIAEQIEEFKAQIKDAQDRCKRYGLIDKLPTSDADLADLGVPRKVLINFGRPDDMEDWIDLSIGPSKADKPEPATNLGRPDDMKDWIDLSIRPSKAVKPEPATNFGRPDDMKDGIDHSIRPSKAVKPEPATNFGRPDDMKDGIGHSIRPSKAVKPEPATNFRRPDDMKDGIDLSIRPSKAVKPEPATNFGRPDDMKDWIDLSIGPSKADKPEPATNFRRPDDMKDWIDLSIGPSKAVKPEPADDIAEQIEEFKAQIKEAQDRCKRYGLLDKLPTSDADLADLGVPRKVTIDPKLLHGEEPGLVALDDPTNQLVNYLIDEEQKLKVVSVLGMGGLGKTTLAKEVYRRHQPSGFECFAFVSVGRNPSIKATLINILHQVIPLRERRQGNMESWDEQLIVADLWKFLSRNRYFIVLRDIWTIRDWKVISCALPDNDLGSRILTTTCIMDVAKSCSLHPRDVIYQMEALSENYSRSLFRSRITPEAYFEEKERPGDFNEVADDMLRKCGGVPLAIIVTASLLDRKSKELGPSKKLQESISSALDQYSTSQGIRKLLDMSYADLSLPLKSCFLYLSAFPENYTIEKDRLIRIWIAEGFIPKRDEESSWETGESYFNELISRRLIQPVFDYNDGQAVGCTVHGVILDFIASLSSEDNFVTTGEELRFGPFPRDTIRRFSFNYSNKDEDEDDSRLTDSSTVHLSRVRSLTFFGDVQGMPGEILHLRFLRVLDLKDASNLRSDHLKGIERLVLLRYLGLRGTSFFELPEGIGQLQHLETLDLRQTLLLDLPASVAGLRKLVRLLLSRHALQQNKIWKMPGLEEVSTIDVDSSNSLNSVSELLIMSKHLRMLGVRWGGNSYDRQCVRSFLNEVGKSSLQSLSLLLDNYPAGDLLDLLLDLWVHPHHFQRFELTISRTLFGGVPRKMASLVNLTHLRIKIDRVDTEGLRVLEALPNLILLDLHLQYSGFERSISRDGFRSLVVFSYTWQFSDGRGLQFTPGAMPQLRRLRFVFYARERGSRHGYYDFGIEHLSCLTQVHATIHCWPFEWVDAAEAAIREQVSKNPNSPVLELSRRAL